MEAQFLDDGVLDDREIKSLSLVCECKADIIWYRVPNSAWTVDPQNRIDNAQARIDEAVKWFDGYCIRLNFQEFALDPKVPAQKKIKDELDALVKEYNALVGRILFKKPAMESLLDEAHGKLLSIYRQIIKVNRGRLVVIFLDEWFVEVGATDDPNAFRTFRSSANDGMRLLIGIDRYDTRSPHILTHELLHALRKNSGKPNAGCIRDFVRVNRVTNAQPRPWPEHYGGKNQDKAMSFITRRFAFRPLRKEASDVLTVREYLTILFGGYVRCTPGCHGKEPKAPPKKPKAPPKKPKAPPKKREEKPTRGKEKRLKLQGDLEARLTAAGERELGRGRQVRSRRA